MGTPLSILASDEEWLEVLTPTGYQAWIPESSVTLMSNSQMLGWRDAPREIIVEMQPGYLTRDTLPPSPANIICDLTAGNILELRDSCGNFKKVSTPDGRTGFIRAEASSNFRALASKEPDANHIINLASWLIGTPYLWGGNSAKTVDCSGLTSLVFMLEGIELPRNASQQALIGEAIDIADAESFKCGDLIFFSDKAGVKVTHVGIATGSGRIIHSSGEVKNESLHPDAPDYIGRPVHSARRILKAPDMKCLLDNPAYF